MKTPTVVRQQRLRRLLKRFEEAAVALSWVGSRFPDERDEIVDEYNEAREELYVWLRLGRPLRRKR